jgi:hypothetical protein
MSHNKIRAIGLVVGSVIICGGTLQTPEGPARLLGFVVWCLTMMAIAYWRPSEA